MITVVKNIAIFVHSSFNSRRIQIDRNDISIYSSFSRSGTPTKSYAKLFLNLKNCSQHPQICDKLFEEKYGQVNQFSIINFNWLIDLPLICVLLHFERVEKIYRSNRAKHFVILPNKHIHTYKHSLYQTSTECVKEKCNFLIDGRRLKHTMVNFRTSKIINFFQWIKTVAMVALRNSKMLSLIYPCWQFRKKTISCYLISN